MSTARHQSVAIDFGGKRRHLVFDFNAMAELEDLAGTFSSAAPTMKALRAATWAGLLAETLDKYGRPTKDTLSLLEVGEILGAMDAEATEALAASIMEARGIAAPPEADRPTPATVSPSA